MGGGCSVLGTVGYIRCSRGVPPPAAPSALCNHDNVIRCILGASATGSAYCSSILNLGTETVYTSTFTPTQIAAALTTQDVYVTETLPTIVESVVVIETTTTTTSDVNIYVRKHDESNENGVDIVHDVEATITNTPNDTLSPTEILPTLPSTPDFAPTPACGAQYSAPAWRLESACSCLTPDFRLSNSTVYLVSTAPTVTMTSTDVVPTTETDATSTSTSTSLTISTSISTDVTLETRYVTI